LHDVEQRRHARHHVLARRGCGRDDRIVRARQRRDQRRGRLGQHVIETRIIGHQNLLDAIELDRGLRDALDVRACDQEVHGRAERLSGGERLGGRILQGPVVMFSDQKRCHGSTRV
jgi:hypothetical protein